MQQATDEYINRLCGFVEEYIDYANETVQYMCDEPHSLIHHWCVWLFVYIDQE